LFCGGTYTTIDDPLATNGTQAFGINDLGQIVGTYNTSNGTHAFIYSGGAFTTIDDPVVNSHTFAHGINNNSQIVGTLSDGTGNHGFLETTVPNPPPPAGTTADMILRGSNMSPAVAGQYELSLSPGRTGLRSRGDHSRFRYQVRARGWDAAPGMGNTMKKAFGEQNRRMLEIGPKQNGVVMAKKRGVSDPVGQRKPGHRTVYRRAPRWALYAQRSSSS
jgi:probable HAF family extracellular repeat protein